MFQCKTLFRNDEMTSLTWYSTSLYSNVFSFVLLIYRRCVPARFIFNMCISMVWGSGT
jgi:hypothetical protein